MILSPEWVKSRMDKTFMNMAFGTYQYSPQWKLVYGGDGNNGDTNEFKTEPLEIPPHLTLKITIEVNTISLSLFYK